MRTRHRPDVASVGETTVGPVKERDAEKNVKTVLERCFPDGIRPGSIIDRNKFARAWESLLGYLMPGEMDLPALLASAGVVHGDKVFPAVGTDGTSVVDFAITIAGRTAGPFFYDCLFKAETARLTKMGVQSGAMLRDHLRQDGGMRLVCGKHSFALRGAPESIEDAVMAVFTEKLTWTRQELEERFPYIPGDRLMGVLMQDSRFVRIAEGEYRLASSILMDESECEKAYRQVTEGVRNNGYFSMSDCSFQRSLERNGNIFLTAIQTKFFDQWLSAGFVRHGQVVCEEGAAYDACAAIRHFCRSHDEVTVSRLLELGETYGLGGGNRALVTAHEEMVRVSVDKFVKPHFVSFDVVATDMALDDLVPGFGVMPLTSVRSFVTFSPIGGWPWNVYLLEAFLRRESVGFAFRSVSSAPRTACGAIVRRSAEVESVVDALALATVEANVPATEESIGKFLLDAGYIQRRRGIQKLVATAARRLLSRQRTTCKEDKP